MPTGTHTKSHRRTHKITPTGAHTYLPVVLELWEKALLYSVRALAEMSME